MYNFQTTLRSLAALAVAAAGCLGSAHAMPVISISPSTQDVLVGGNASVDIVVSNLTQPGEAIGGFWIQLGFDDSLLAQGPGLGFTVDPDAKMPGGLDFSFGWDTPGPGSLDLGLLADPGADQAALALLQGGSFRLATVTFTGIANGLSPLTLTVLDLSNADGSGLIDNTTQNGQICVGGNCGGTVPEPGTYGLAGIALLAAGWAGRARRRQGAVA
jgi:PEP-CTERM motif